MKSIQPDRCERCGAALAIEGDMCYQRNCIYIKQTTLAQDIGEGLVDFTINEVQSGEGSIRQQLQENKEMFNGGLDFVSENTGIKNVTQAKSEKDDGDSDDSFLGDLQGGCIWGFFKLLWNIISFPFKLILRILSIFD